MSASLALPYFPDDDASDTVSSLTERETVPTFEAERAERPRRARLAIRFPDGVAPRWLDRVIAQLSRILQLEDGWDSYGARAVKMEAARGMIKLLARLGSDIAPPDLFPSSDGSVIAEWNTPSGSLEMKFLGEDRLSFFAEHTGGRELEEEGISHSAFVSDFYPKIEPLIPRG